MSEANYVPTPGGYEYLLGHEDLERDMRQLLDEVCVHGLGANTKRSPEVVLEESTNPTECEIYKQYLGFPDTALHSVFRYELRADKTLPHAEPKAFLVLRALVPNHARPGNAGIFCRETPLEKITASEYDLEQHVYLLSTMAAKQ